MAYSAVVTGGANGIGRALCLELAGRGYSVVADISPEEADATRRDITESGMPAETVARIAVDGAEQRQFYIFTHSHAEAYARKRFEEIVSGFALLNEREPSDRSYDVNQVVEELMAVEFGGGNE